MKNTNKDFTYGAVLKVEREHTREEIRKILLEMKSAGMNTVVIWPAVYWWEEEGPYYPFATGRAILEDAAQVGIGVIMELAGQITALEYAPDFLMKEEYFCVDKNGVKDDGGLGYGTLNFNHPDIIRLITQQYTRIAAEYKSFPALKGYDIWNETQFTSFDEHTLALFREWLKRKYGSLKKLNDSWDRIYRSWEDIRFTSWMWASVMAFVDYQEFHKENIALILNWMRKSIEAEDSVHEILADNIHSSVTMDHYYNRPTDDWAVAKEVDQYGISFYPKFLSRMTPPFLRHQTMTGAHSAAPDGLFMISEMQTHHATMFNPEGSVSPGELWQWCWEAIAHGCNGIIYWKWNPFRKGVQTFGRGLVDAKGRETPRLKTAERLAKLLNKESDLCHLVPEKPLAAILFDKENQDFTKAYTIGFRGMIGAPDSIYLDSISGLYRTLWEHNIPTVFVTPEDLHTGKTDDIPYLFITTQVTMDESMKEDILRYTETEGTVIADGKFGEISRLGLLYPQIPGAGLSEKLGLELLDMEQADLSIRFGDDQLMTGGHDRRQMGIWGDDVRILAHYQDNTPAIVESPLGQGRLIYISTFLWYGCRKNGSGAAWSFLKPLMEKHIPLPADSSAPSIHVERLCGQGADYLIAFNYGEAQTAAFTIDEPCLITDIETDSLLGEGTCWSAFLPAGGVGIYRLSRKGE